MYFRSLKILCMCTDPSYQCDSPNTRAKGHAKLRNKCTTATGTEVQRDDPSNVQSPIQIKYNYCNTENIRVLNVTKVAKVF